MDLDKTITSSRFNFTIDNLLEIDPKLSSVKEDDTVKLETETIVSVNNEKIHNISEENQENIDKNSTTNPEEVEEHSPTESDHNNASKIENDTDRRDKDDVDNDTDDSDDTNKVDSYSEALPHSNEGVTLNPLDNANGKESKLHNSSERNENLQVRPGNLKQVWLD